MSANCAKSLAKILPKDLLVGWLCAKFCAQKWQNSLEISPQNVSTFLLQTRQRRVHRKQWQGSLLIWNWKIGGKHSLTTLISFLGTLDLAKVLFIEHHFFIVHDFMRTLVNAKELWQLSFKTKKNMHKTISILHRKTQHWRIVEIPMTDRKQCSNEFNTRCGLQPTHKWIVLLNEGRCVAIVKTLNIIHVLYIKPASGHFHPQWSYETQRSICITFQKVYCKPVRGRRLPKRPQSGVSAWNGDCERAFVLESRPSSIDVQKEIPFITHGAAVFLQLFLSCVNTSHKQELFEGFFKLRQL